jgi:hypothetical protein
MCSGAKVEIFNVHANPQDEIVKNKEEYVSQIQTHKVVAMIVAWPFTHVHLRFSEPCSACHFTCSWMSPMLLDQKTIFMYMHRTVLGGGGGVYALKFLRRSWPAL